VTLGAILGLTAGLLQALAYAAYFRQVLAEDCRPNGMTWLMWTYGTAVLFFIEYDMGAPFAVLVLPAVCLLCSIGVAGYAFARASCLPPERQDWAVLSLDLGITIGYVVLVMGSDAVETGLVFVLLTGLTNFTSSWPIMRTTYREPHNERPIAWFIWSAAYALLALVAMIEDMPWPYLVYPLCSLVVHLAIGFFTLETMAARRARRSGRPS
jgi:hypothetical protein